MTQRTLTVGIYDPETDTIMIEGTRYHGDLFRAFGFKSKVGQTWRIDAHEDGVLTVTTSGLDPSKPYKHPWRNPISEKARLQDHDD